MAQAAETTTVFDNGDYSLNVTLSPVLSPIDGQALIITSKRKESRNPNEEQVRFMACLDREGLTKLADLISEQLAKESSRQSEAREKSQVLMENTVRRLQTALKNGVDLSGQDTP